MRLIRRHVSLDPGHLQDGPQLQLCGGGGVVWVPRLLLAAASPLLRDLLREAEPGTQPTLVLAGVADTALLQLGDLVTNMAGGVTISGPKEMADISELFKMLHIEQNFFTFSRENEKNEKEQPLNCEFVKSEIVDTNVDYEEDKNNAIKNYLCDEKLLNDCHDEELNCNIQDNLCDEKLVAQNLQSLEDKLSTEIQMMKTQIKNELQDEKKKGKRGRPIRVSPIVITPKMTKMDIKELSKEKKECLMLQRKRDLNNEASLRFRKRKKGLLAQEEAELEAETQKNITLKKVLQFLTIKHAILRNTACELCILGDK